MTSLRIRVGALCCENHSILLVRHEKEGKTYWMPPGGGMRAGEPAEEALVREVFEETSIRVACERVVCICESVWPDRERHVVHFLYETKRVGGEAGKSHDPRVTGSAFISTDSLDTIALYPPIRAWLAECASTGFPNAPVYLGPLWK
ncbi:MAG: NUDIX hydrolase [Candidatus Abyssobacteria bacterium SURF_17]|uniref:NUDIX hydrolase n=1 Tax=Candidatus Abyssobacteria bacterium SURF_17 TaxID=2093361 RepID=A0A419F0R5_9BACT|nr:MAG: NUDIX hydrolase [Candidatus Abyssubacteria bacterium SURF_17]